MVAVGLFALFTLAAARGTRLVVSDQITAPLRRRIATKYGADGWLTYLVHCPFCVSVWASAIAAAYWTVVASTSWWIYPPAVFAMSYLVAPVLLKFDQED